MDRDNIDFENLGIILGEEVACHPIDDWGMVCEKALREVWRKGWNDCQRYSYELHGCMVGEPEIDMELFKQANKIEKGEA